MPEMVALYSHLINNTNFNCLFYKIRQFFYVIDVYSQKRSIYMENNKYWLHRISHEWDVAYKLLSEGWLTIGWSSLYDSGIELPNAH